MEQIFEDIRNNEEMLITLLDNAINGQYIILVEIRTLYEILEEKYPLVFAKESPGVFLKERLKRLKEVKEQLDKYIKGNSARKIKALNISQTELYKKINELIDENDLKKTYTNLEKEIRSYYERYKEIILDVEQIWSGCELFERELENNFNDALVEVNKNIIIPIEKNSRPRQ